MGLKFLCPTEGSRNIWSDTWPCTWPGITVDSDPLSLQLNRERFTDVKENKANKRLGIYKIFFPLKVKKVSQWDCDFSHLVSEGFCLTRNFLLGIPISAALTQYKNKDIQIMFLEREKIHDYKSDTGWEKQIISKLVHYWKTCNKHTKDKFQERRVLIG